MRIRLARFAALVLAIGLVAPLFAQRQPGGMGRGMDGSMLLTQKSVQEEIKLTEDQVAKVEKVGKDLREKFAELLLREVLTSLRDPDPDTVEQELIDLEIYQYCKTALDAWRRGLESGSA